MSKPHHTMRVTITVIGVFLAFLALRTAASDRAADPAAAPDPATGLLERRFRDTVRPFIGTYCLECHGKDKPKGDLDLSAYPTMEAVARDYGRWETVLEQLQAGVDAAGEGEAASAGRAPAGGHRLDPGAPQSRRRSGTRAIPARSSHGG